MSTVLSLNYSSEPKRKRTSKKNQNKVRRLWYNTLFQVELERVGYTAFVKVFSFYISFFFLFLSLPYLKMAYLLVPCYDTKSVCLDEKPRVTAMTELKGVRA